MSLRFMHVGDLYFAGKTKCFAAAQHDSDIGFHCFDYGSGGILVVETADAKGHCGQYANPGCTAIFRRT